MLPTLELIVGDTSVMWYTSFRKIIIRRHGADIMVNEFYEPVECSVLEPNEKEQVVFNEH